MLRGASEKTNVLSYAGHRLFPRARMPFKVAETTRFLGAVGRIAGRVLPVILVYDAV